MNGSSQCQIVCDFERESCNLPSPKTTCLPSSHEVMMVVMKNWDPINVCKVSAENVRK